MSPKADSRSERFTMRLAAAEKGMLDALAGREGLNASDFLRVTIRRLHAEAFGDKPEKKKR
jgi:uncharacterized protein (DUF1778 family)